MVATVRVSSKPDIPWPEHAYQVGKGDFYWAVNSELWHSSQVIFLDTNGIALHDLEICQLSPSPTMLLSFATCTQLVEHRTGIAEVTGSNPVEALIFFRLLLSNCLNWKIYCDDHSSLSVPILLMRGIIIWIFRTNRPWLVNRLSFGNTSSLFAIPLLSIKRLGVWSKFQGVIKWTIAF